MTRLTLLPAVDVTEGHAVQLVQGVAGSGGQYGDPLQAALAWQRAGTSWIHLVDLDAAFGRGSNADLLAEVVRSLDVNVEMSGGIRDDESLARALATAQGAAAAGAWLDDSFEVAELHVTPGHQGHGVGAGLLLRLTSDRPERTAVLSTRDADSPARRLYRGVGFTDLLTGFSLFPGSEPPYAVMGAELPLRARLGKPRSARPRR